MGGIVDYKIVCQYVTEDDVNCDETIIIFDNNLTQLGITYKVGTVNAYAYDKLVKMNENHVAPTLQSDNTLYYSLYKIKNVGDNNEFFEEKIVVTDVSNMNNCVQDCNKVNSGSFSGKSTCFNLC